MPDGHLLRASGCRPSRRDARAGHPTVPGGNLLDKPGGHRGPDTTGQTPRLAQPPTWHSLPSNRLLKESLASLSLHPPVTLYSEALTPSDFPLSEETRGCLAALAGFVKFCKRCVRKSSVL